MQINKREINDEIVRIINNEYGNIAVSVFSGTNAHDYASNKITLNIAGNGIYTMKGKYTQAQLDEYVYQLLSAVMNSENLKNKIISIRSGGQTGIDEAGAKAGMRLGIPTTILAPKGWTFRPINGKDKSSESDLPFLDIKSDGSFIFCSNKEVSKCITFALPGYKELI